MTSYKLVAVRNTPLVLDVNENNVEPQTDVLKHTPTSLSDDEDRGDSEKTFGLRARSQSLKNLTRREEPGPITRSKSLRDVDTGDFNVSRARVAYIESWNPINPVGRGKIAKRIKSWENSLDTEEDVAEKLKSYHNEMERGNYSGSRYNGTSAQDYDNYKRNETSDYRYEGYGNYSPESAQYAYDSYRDRQSEVDVKMPDTDPTSADAEWKKIQQNTFTRWCNEHLKCVNKYIYNLETDLVDGLKLIALLQVLSHKKISRFNKKPSFRPQKLENISIALKFIESENIRLVNIDASDIFKGNIKLILGLIWTLILKYQISMPYLDEEEEGGQKMTPKQALLAWVKSKMPESVPMENFNTHWNDGRAVACLVDAVAPGLFPECEDLDPNDALENAKQAMQLAEDWLGVPQVITPQEITNPNVDELSVMTYVSYFPEAKVKPGAPIRPRTHPSTKCYAKGPGVEPKGLVVKKPAFFTVYTQGAGKGKLGVSVWGPGKEEQEVTLTDNGDHTYACQYFPQSLGKYDVHVKWNGRHIPKSPFRVEVGADLDASQAYASGPGLQPEGIQAGKYTDFTVYTKDAGEGQVSVKVIDPRGGEDVDIIIEPQEDGKFFVEYQPVNAGKHTIKVTFGGQPISQSPFHVKVNPPRVEPIPSKVRVFGIGVEPTGIKAGQKAPFTIDGRGAGDGEPDVFVEGPQGEEKVDIKNNGDGTYSCIYFPAKYGNYIVNVTWSSVQVPNSPFHVKVATAVDASKIKAYGPGLEKGTAGKPCEFTVETKGAGIDSLGFAIEGPSQAEIQCTESSPGICEVRYFPTTPGKYAIHVTCGEVDIPNSPFMVPISPPGDSSKVFAEGPGLEPEGVVAGVPAEFKVYTKDAGEGDVEVKVLDSQGKKVPVEIKPSTEDKTYDVVYYPSAVGKYTVYITFNSENIPKSPFQVGVVQTNSAACRAYGPGLEKGFVNQNNEFKIETKGAGEGGLGLTIEGPSEAQIECKDNGDGSCDVSYLPPDPGDYVINILFADQHIPGSPFKARISYPFDASKVKVEGPGIEPGVRAGEPADIDIDTRLAGDEELIVEVVDELNSPVKCEVEEEEYGIYAVTYYPKKKGGHRVNVKYGGVHAPGSPFKIPILPTSDASKVKVMGPGVEKTGVQPGKPTWFTINATEAGKGDVNVKIEPKARSGRPVDVQVTEEGKDTFKCEYVAPVEGEYKVDVTFDSSPVPGSPFLVEVAKPGDAGKCKAKGDGLEIATINELAEFDVDCKDAGEAQLMAAVDNPSGAHTDTLVTDNGDGTYSVSYTPFEEGIHKLSVKFGGDDIPGSPFKVDVLPPTDASKCKAYGPGLENALVDRPAEFTVETKGAGAGGLSLAIEGPSEAKLTCTDNGDGTCAVKYTPSEPGDYEIHIKFADQHIPGSPFNAKVTRPVDASKVKCYGPGVDRISPLYSKTPQEFTVDTSEAGDADLEVTVDAPRRKVLKPEPVCEKGDGVYTVEYTPEEEGSYTVNVKYGDKHVPNSPFRVRAGPPFDASKVKVSGPGVDESPVTDEPVQFLCDCSEAGTAPLTATVSPPSGPDVPVEVKDNGDGCYTVEYTPERPGRHSVDLKYGGRRVPKSPFRVQVNPSGDASKVEIDGLGPDDKFFVGKENDFTVDTSQAGKGKPKCTIKGPNRKEIPVEVVDNEDGTYDCLFTPEEVGRHNVDVLFGGAPVPGSPLTFKAEKPVDVDKIKCEPKADKEPVVDEELVYAVDARPAESAPGEIPDGLLNGVLSTPLGAKEPVRIKDNKDGTYDVACVPKEPGPHELALDYNGVPLSGSPYKFVAVEGGADKVKAYGKGLTRGLTGEPAEFTLDTKDAGPGGLALAVHGPSKAEITCQDNGDGTCSVKYIPDEPGDYNISCKFADKDIPGSPFTAHIYSNYDDLDAAAPRPTVGKPCDVELKIPETFRPEDVKNGDVTAELERPDGRKEPLEPLRVNDDGTLSVTFIPYEPGEHLIHVYKRGNEVQNSPFSVMVQAQRVGDIYPVGHTCDLDFKIPDGLDVNDLVGKLKRPSGKVDESLTLKPGPKPGTISVSFVPREVGEHFLSIRKKSDGSPIAGSPFSILVESEEPVEGVGCPVDYCFSLDDVALPDDILKERVKGTLKRPSSDKEEPIDLKLNSDNTLSCSFVPRETGLHYIFIRKYGKQVEGSPFVIKVTAPEGVSTVGKPYGMGLESPDVTLPEDYPRLSATLKRPSSPKEEELKLVLNGDNTLGVAFTPREEGEHLIHLRKDNKEVDGSPFSVMVGAKEKVEEVHPMGRTCDVNLDIQGVTLPEDLENGLLKGFLKRPNSAKEEPLKLEITRDNSLGVSFVPQEPGEHQISVRKKTPDRNWRDVPGSPFSIMVEAAEAVNAVGTPCDCLLDIPNLRIPEDLSRLTAKLKRPSGKDEEDLKLRVTSDNRPFVSFVPREAGEHLISIKKYRDHVKGSPFSVMVVAPEAGNPIGRPCGVGLEIPGLKLPEDYNDGLLSASLQRPSGKPEEPLPLALNSDNTLSVSFTPQETGEHFVTVKKSGNHVNGSPFSVMVSGPGPADPSKVVCSGPGLSDGVAGKPCSFLINTRDAGYGGLGLSIEGPSKAEIKCTDNEDGTCSVEYLPLEPGKYNINVKFADEDVPGSPFTSTVSPSGDEPIQLIEQDLVSSGAPGTFGEPTQRVSQVFEDLVTFGSTPAQPHDFVFDLKGYKMDDLETMVISPDGTELESEIIESSPKTYTIRFVPKESGEHTIYVRFKSGRKKDIPGSPFKVFVEAPVWGGAAKCVAAGPGLERGVVNHPGEFTVWTRDAGPGGLAIAIEGPAKSEIKCTDNGDGSCNISYLPTTPGEYTVHIRFADEDIPGSPFKVIVSPEVEDRFRDLNVSDLAESGLKVNQPASFSVQTNADVGDVSASVVAPSGEEKDAQVSKLGGGNFAIRFTPREFGDHLVNVRFDGAHIPGSPFKIRVGGVEGHPEKVKAFGGGLSSGQVGAAAEFTVNALEAGSGALALSVDGPAKVKMNCSENADGTYQVTYNPAVAGEYTIRIKFAGQDIPGSPYNVIIHPSDGKYRSDGDASKCTSRGTGLHSAVIGQPNSFTVNASNAGRGSLMVGVEGPAIPAKEITVKHTGSNVYAVNYALEDPGTYVLKVLWADKHIPGSPFHVTV